MSDVTPTADRADIWDDGALITARAAEFIGRSLRRFWVEARRQNWPRRYRGHNTLWPKRALSEYLANLPAVRGKHTDAVR